MNSLLHSLFLLSFFMVFGFTSAQTSSSHDLLHKHENSLVSHFEHDMSKKNVFSYNLRTNTQDDHTYGQEIVLMDLISSENTADFNCSGGFCMTTSHFHKKGLTSHRQLFEYFMNITC